MIKFVRLLDRKARCNVLQYVKYSQAPDAKPEEEFRVLNLKQVKSQPQVRRKFKKPDVMPPRANEMPVDQEWGNVWPGPRSFHPAIVPLSIRQGFVPIGKAPPGKFANAELMKIPNFLHLTPPVIKKQCEALKQFCTPWPEGLESDDKQKQHFPVEVITSDYCHSSPTIRDPLARIVTIRLKLSTLPLDQHARDKFLRLVGDRYDPETDVVTIVTDRCPTRKQNYDYGQYLLTALFHESWMVEPWEADKSEADMEYYDWSRNESRKTVIAIHSFGKAEAVQESEIPNVVEYSQAVSQLINEGENDRSVNKYKESVKKMLSLPNLE